MSTPRTRTLVTELHRAMDLDRALAWFNGIFSGDDWAMHDQIEVVTDDGRRIVQLTVWGSRWTLEVDIEETRALGGVLVSARVTDPAVGCELPELTGLARALVP
ncbi:MAG: hypothetical protein HKO87_07960 [Acidimicrobiia bacterium]|nr:hypothetical protein [Acidimicrobiia bacterium]